MPLKILFENVRQTSLKEDRFSIRILLVVGGNRKKKCNIIAMNISILFTFNDQIEITKYLFSIFTVAGCPGVTNSRIRCPNGAKMGLLTLGSTPLTG